MERVSKSEYVMDVLTGVGLGGLLGLMVGLSASPLVNTFVGAVAALLVTLLGLRDGDVGPADGEARTEKEPTPARQRGRAHRRNLRISSFALACALAAVGSLWARTHDVLGEALEHRLARARQAWTQADYSQEDVQRLVVYQELGTIPAGALGTPLDGAAGPPDAHRPATSSGVLFSGNGPSKDDCLELRRYEFATSQAALAAFKARGRGWRRAAELAEAHWNRDGAPHEAQRLETLDLVRELSCAMSD